MIAMMVRVQDMRDPPSQIVGAFQHRIRHSRVNDRTEAAVRLPDQINVVVIKDGDLFDFQFSHISPVPTHG